MPRALKSSVVEFVESWLDRSIQPDGPLGRGPLGNPGEQADYQFIASIHPTRFGLILITGSSQDPWLHVYRSLQPFMGFYRTESNPEPDDPRYGSFKNLHTRDPMPRTFSLFPFPG